MKKAQIHFTNKTKLLAIVLAAVFLLAFTLSAVAEAAPGINPQVNFQGKVVNKTAGTNIINGDYDFVFRLYDDPSAGSELWEENHTSANDVAVTDGIFRVALGSITSLSTVDFNSDALYLEIEFEVETMGTRIRFASVPYAFNAQKVNGLTVTNNGGNTLNIAASKTFTVSNSLTFTGTDSTSFAFPTTGGGTVIVNNISGQSIAGAFSLTGSSGDLTLAGTTGLTFSGTGGDITFANGEKIDNDVNGTIAVTGSLSSSGLITAGTGLTLTTGPITLGGSTGSSQCLLGGASASWGSCGSGGSSNWRLSSGAISPINNTLDLLIGSNASTSAKFAVLNVNSGTPTASISANSGNNAAFLTGAGVLGTANRQTLTLGNAATTGNVLVKAGDISGTNGLTVFVTGGDASNIGGEVRILGGTGTDTQGGNIYIDGGGSTLGKGSVFLCNSLCSTIIYGYFTAFGEVNLGDNGDNVVINSNTWDVSGTGIISGLTGLTMTSGAITLGGSTGTGQCLLGGASASWGSCGAGGTNWWTTSADGKALTPVNNTMDFLIGGIATSSAKFVVLNVNSGIPVGTANANEDYDSTLIVDLSGNNKNLADQLAEELKGQVKVFPSAEDKPDADILVILGAAE